MKSSVETLSPTRVKLTVEIPFDEFQSSLDAAVRTIARQVSIPGFRKGKVPARVIEQRVGRGAVLEEAVNDALPKAYEAALRENAVTPLGRPDIEVTELADGERLAFTAEVDVRPEFDLPDYSSISVTVPDVEPSDADVDAQLDGLRGRFATLTPVDRAAADGDLLLVDLAATDDEGGAVEDLTASALSYELGTDGMLPGFDDAVRGAVAGESRTFDFTPEVGPFVDRPLTVSVTVSAVRDRTLPPADDSFAQLASEFDTIEELRADLRTRLERVRAMEQGVEARTLVHEALLDLVDFPLPEGLLTAEIEEHFADGHGDADHRLEFANEARRSLKSQLIHDRIADAEQVSVSESDLSSWLIQRAPRYGMTPDAFAKALVENNQLPLAIQDIRRAKALNAVLMKATVTDASGRSVDLGALEAQALGMPGGFTEALDTDE